MTSRAWLSVTPEFLRDRLGLPPNVEIVRADMNGANFELRLGIQGEGLPIVEEGVETPTVMILMHQTDDVKTGLRSLHGSWSHDPEKKWLIKTRPIPPVDLEFAKALADTAPQPPPSDHQS